MHAAAVANTIAPSLECKHIIDLTQAVATLRMSCNSENKGPVVRVLQIQSAGYKYLSSKVKDTDDADAAQKAEDDFLLRLDNMEEQLSKHKGPYLVG